MTDLTRREQWLFIPLIALIFWIGVYPSPLLRRSEASVRALVQDVRERGVVQSGSRAVAPSPDDRSANHESRITNHEP